MSNAVLAGQTDFYRLDARRRLDPKNQAFLGQFMTPVQIARFMASFFEDLDRDEIELLDPGAGVGSLTAAFVDDCLRQSPRPKTILATVYEIDSVMAEYLENTLAESGGHCAESGVLFNGEIKRGDFIEDGAATLAADLFSTGRTNKRYSHVIMNPPYKKIANNSKHRQWLRRVGIETPNLYAGFLALAIKLLSDDGELVAIVPRSFCNGPYFKPFRELLLSEMAIRRIHVFHSRKQAFQEDGVLQENIIFHAVKSGAQSNVRITASSGGSFVTDDETGHLVAQDMTARVVDFPSVVRPDDPEKFIHIATTETEQRIVDRVSLFTATLADLEIQVSTGPVVDFRLKSDLCQAIEEGAVPLLYPVHFRNNRLEWPKETKKPNAIRITDESRKWLWKNEGHLVVTKRFTSKEEKRRIVAAVYDGSLPGDLIGIENHLNIFHRNRGGMPKDVALGLALFLNSTLLDRYFRQFNGHTQVNATDLRSMYYPDLEMLENWGRQIGDRKLTQDEIDAFVEKEIGEMADDTEIDPLLVQQKIDQALSIVKALGLPRGQHNERSALTLLAILNLKPEGNWQDLERPLIGITPIIEFCSNHYGRDYAPNTREIFRRQTMHQFVDGAIAIYNPDEPARPVNSPNACYQISPEAHAVISSFGSEQWDASLEAYLKERKTLAQRYAKEREMEMIPVQVADGKEIMLSPGVHSQLIKDIIAEFAPRYAPGSEVIYVGDTGDKAGYFQRERLAGLGVEVDKHGKMPDVVLYFPKKDWLLLVESVTSHGPVDGKRHEELAALFKSATPGLVYVTAFPDRAAMAKYLSDISWETEVWAADAPTHMIHFNGERFLGPYEK